MTSEKDYNKHKTEKQLSQLKDRLDKEGVGTHGTSCPPPSCTAPLGRAPSTSVIAAEFGHLPLQLRFHRSIVTWNRFSRILISIRCVGCAIVESDHAPDCGVAQGVVHGVFKHHGRNQEEVEEELEKEVERQGGRRRSNTNAHDYDHG